MGSITRSFANNILAAGKFDGTKLTGDIPEANLSANAPAFDDNKIVNDLSTLGLRVHTQENLAASNTNSQYVDVFQDDTGIDTETNTDRNASEYVSSVGTSSQTLISPSGKTLIGNMTENGGLSAAFDGTKGGTWDTGARKDPSTGANIGIDWGSGNSFVVSRAKIWGTSSYGVAGNTSSRYGKLQGSNDNSSWTDIYTISSVRTNSNQVADVTTTPSHDINHHGSETFSSTAAFRYHRWLFEGDANGGSISELEFFQGGGTALVSTGNFTGTTITAPSSISSMGAVITYQDQAGTNALNTDIVLQLSADNGSNYSTATLTALPDFSSGIKMAKVNDLSVTAGTQLKYKILFANQASGSKEARIRGVSLNY